MFASVDLPFVQYVVTTETVIHDYLIVRKCSWKRISSGIPHPQSDRYLSAVVTFPLRDVPSYIYDMTYNLHHFLLSQSLY